MHLLILAESGDAAGGGALIGTMLPLLAIGFFVYFVMIRPQRKRQQEFKAMQSDLSVGDLVHTIGGIQGVVDRIDDDHVDLTVTSDGTVLRFKRSAIGDIVRDEVDDDVDDADDADVSDEASS